MTTTTSSALAKGTIAEWTIREQLILASAVQRSGDQNWVSVSRAVKPLVEDVRPADYFSQKNCALQYSAMLDKAGTPKRKRTSEGAPEAVETAEQQIVRQLTEKRVNELNVSLQQTRDEYLALKKEIEQLEKGELDEKIPEMWAEMNAEIAAKEALERKRESSPASLKLKSPPPKLKSPPPSSNLAKYQAQLKLRKMKSPPPLSVPMELSSPTSPTSVIPPSVKGEESSPHKTLSEAKGEKMDIEQPSPSKSPRPRTLSPLKLSLGGAPAKKDFPIISPGSTPTSSSPVAKSLPVVTTPKEETLGGVPMQAPHPSTEGNLQLSSNMHIIVQQPNTALLESGDGRMPIPKSSDVQQPPLEASDVQEPSKESVGNKVIEEPSHIGTIPPPATSSGTPLKTALAPTLVTNTPAVASAPSSTSAPLTVSAMVAIPSPAQMDTPTVKQEATLTSAHGASPTVTEDATPTITRVTTPTTIQSLTSTVVQEATLTQAVTEAMAQVATPTTTQVTTPIAVAGSIPTAEPVTSLHAPAVSKPSLSKPDILPATGISFVAQPSPAAAAQPPATLARSTPQVVESISQPSPQTILLPPTTVLTSSIPEVPLSLIASESFPKAIDSNTATVQLFSVKSAELATSVQPSSKTIESSYKDVGPSPMDIENGPTRHVSPLIQPSPAATHSHHINTQPSTEANIPQASPKIAPKLVQTTLKLPLASPKVTHPTEKVTHPAAKVTHLGAKVPQSPSKAAKSAQKTDKAPPEVTEEPTTVTQPSSTKHEPVSVATVVSSHSLTPPMISSSTAAPPPLPSKSKTTPKLTIGKLASSSVSPLGSPSPLLSTHTTTPSPLVTTAMKAPLVSSAVKTVEDKSLDEVDGGEGMIKAKQESKTMAKKKERERRRSASEEQTPVKSPISKIKCSPEKVDIQELGESKPSKKASTPRRSPSSSPSSTNARTVGATAKSPKSPPAARKGKESSATPKTPPKDTTREKSEKVEEEKREEITSPTVKDKIKETVVKEGGTGTPVSQPQDKEKPVTSASVVAASPATPSQLREVEQDEGEMEETPVKATRTSRKTPQRRSRKRRAEDDGPSVESTDTEEEIASSAQTSAVPSPSPSLTGEADMETIQARKQWKKAIMLVWRHAAQHKYANLFLHPVREEDAPGYRDVILRPMDLSTIKRKIESGLIKTDMEFQRDMLLMFQNAFMYNSSDHDVFFMAQSMKTDVMENIQAYLATQAQLQLMGEEPLPQKTLRSREGRRTVERDLYEESLFSPAKKRRLKGDD